MNRLRRAAIIAFSMHLLAGISVALILTNGLETNTNFTARLNFIVGHPAPWGFGWLTFTAAAISILYFYDALASTHRLERFAVLLTAAAIVADITGHTIEFGVLPSIAYRVLSSETTPDTFLLLHRIVVLLSAYVANTLYSLSALILAWRTRGFYPRQVWISGIAVGVCGFAMSVAAIAESTDGLFWTNAILFPLILLWLALVALSARPGPADMRR